MGAIDVLVFVGLLVLKACAANYVGLVWPPASRSRGGLCSRSSYVPLFEPCYRVYVFALLAALIKAFCTVLKCPKSLSQ